MKLLFRRDTCLKTRRSIAQGSLLIMVGLFIIMINQHRRHFGKLQDADFAGYHQFSSPEIDINSTVTKLWPDDPECSKFDVGFAFEIEPTYLVSFPRSGNTWTRYLIEGATGVYSGSVYEDMAIYDMGYKGELEPYDSRRLIIIKTHTQAFKDTPRVNLQGTTFVILLLRNPADAITSYWSFKGGRKESQSPHNYTMEEVSYKGKEFRLFVRSHIDMWSQICESPLVWTKHLLVVFYEELVENPMQQMDRILQFLEIPKNEERMKCLAKHIRGPAKRKHDPIDPIFKPEKKFIAHAMSNVIGLLHLRGIKVPTSYMEWIKPFNPQLNLSLNYPEDDNDS